MSSISEHAAPAAKRIEALDVVRGAALLGILLMNITDFGLPDAYTNPRNSGGADGANLWVWIVTQIGFEGTQRGLFSMLFGAGVILITSRLEGSGRDDAAQIYFRRMWWLILFGLFNAYVLLWANDILYPYAMVGLLLYAFREVSAPRLLAIGVAALVGAAAWNVADTRAMLDAQRGAQPALTAEAMGGSISPAQQATIDRWDWKRSQFETSPEAIAEEVAAKTGGYASAFDYVARINVYAQTWGLARYFLDMFGMMVIGMGLFRLGVLTLERRPSVYAAMAIAGYGVGLTVNILETRHIVAADFSALAFSETGISYDLGRLAMTVGHLGALLLFVRSRALRRLRRALAAVGRMALTSYLTHSLVCAIIFIGFRQYGQWQRYELYYVVLAIWAAQLAGSVLWLRHFRFGPVEWLWRGLTYGRMPAVRIDKSGAGATPAL